MAARPLWLDRCQSGWYPPPMILGVRDGLICRTPDAGGTMGKVIAAITTSVDGYIVGPQDGRSTASASRASVSTTG